jgi:hypothetical protein
MTDIYDMRVSGDTLSHLLLLTSEPGAVLFGRPQVILGSLILSSFFSLKMTSHPHSETFLSACLFTVDDVNSDTDQDQADN